MRRIPARRLMSASVAVALTVAAAPALSKSYEYDALGRMTKVTYDDGSYIIYTYDAAGNRTVVSATKV
jgi:YD repeat-containing protein